MKKNSNSLFAIIGKAAVLTIPATACFVLISCIYRDTIFRRTVDMFQFLTESVLFAAMCAVFCGVVAALAIHTSFQQAVKQEQFELRIREQEKTAETVIDLVGRSIAVNTLPNCGDIPHSEDELNRRKEMVYELYQFVEANYAKILVSGVLFDYGRKTQKSKRLEDIENRVCETQRNFAREYRKLYHRLHQFIDFSSKNIHSLYMYNGMWIWDLASEADATQNPDSILGLQALRPGISDAVQKQQELLNSITESAVATRDSLTVFTQNYKDYERALLLYAGSSIGGFGSAAERFEKYRKECKDNPLE